MYRKIFCILLLIQALFLRDSYAGTFRVYPSGEKCMLEMPREMLGRLFLVVSRLDSVGGNRTYQPGSKLGQEFVISFRQEEAGKVNVYMPDYRLRGEASSGGMENLLARNQVEWAVLSCPVLEEGEQDIVIDITELLKKEKPFFEYAGKRIVGFDGGKDFFACTVGRELSVVRRKWKRDNDEMTEMPVTSVFFLLPEQPWLARDADRRVGFSSVSYDYFGDESSGARTRYLIRRWALEPRDKEKYAAGQLTEPAMPIVFYLDPAIPACWKPYFVRAVEDWQRAFETAGYRNAIVARDMPEDMAWKASSVKGFIHYQDSVLAEAADVNVDPRSGQIIQAHVHWSPALLDSLKYEWITRSALWQPKFDPEQLPEQVVGELIRVTLGKRVGLALGLLPNELSASRYSLMGSMILNTEVQPEDRVAVQDLFPRVDRYDGWAIDWGYRYGNEKTVRERVNQSGYQWYAKSRESLIEPDANLGYWGDDPVRGAESALENMKRVFTRADLVKVKGDTTGWGAWVRRAGEKEGVLYEIVLPVLRQIGGMAVLPDAAREYVMRPSPVSRAQQEAAAAFLNRNVFATPRWLTESRLIRKAGAVPEKIVLDWQCAVLEYLFDKRLERFALNNLMMASDSPYSLDEFMDSLYQGIWADLGSEREDTCRMALRMRYLEILKNRLNRSPRSDVSVALQLHLNKLNAAVTRVSGEDSPNPQIRESCNDLKMEIEDVLK